MASMKSFIHPFSKFTCFQRWFQALGTCTTILKMLAFILLDDWIVGSTKQKDWEAWLNPLPGLQHWNNSFH
ncbi:hypothetical protein SLA2020_408040 [Shorea laevis]